MQQANRPLPKPVLAHLLIDTGASCTCIDPSIITQLGITPRGITTIQTPSTQGQPHQVQQYDVSIAIPLANAGVQTFHAVPVVTTPLSSQGIQGLLGRDILNYGLFTYNGPARIHLLGF